LSSAPLPVIIGGSPVFDGAVGVTMTFSFRSDGDVSR
jgi:hypothetical protein